MQLRAWQTGVLIAGLLAACSADEADPTTGQVAVVLPPKAATAGSLAASAGSAAISNPSTGTANTFPPPSAASAGSSAARPPTAAMPTPAPGAGSPLPSGQPPAAPPPAGVTPPPSMTPPPGPATPPGMLPPSSDYTKPGPFATMTVANTGPDGMFTMIRPTELGKDGFKHPPLTWGNGITTTPATYPVLFSTIASNGFVIIASNSSTVAAAQLTQGLDWLIQQNGDASSPLHDKLDVSRAVSMGYSLGGGAALTAAAHKNVICTIAMHPAPGAGAHAPVLLFTGTDDTVVAPTLVQASYGGITTVPAMLATLDGATHFEPVLSGGQELGPSIAWLRLWVFDDQAAKSYFYGPDCKLCKAPWSSVTNQAWK
ncbi:MAG TPA: hypothetical protein VFG30_18880 [Polyangiales bacterium]|nr:hypothetical protein [Polyangiales bacterium]